MYEVCVYALVRVRRLNDCVFMGNLAFKYVKNRFASNGFFFKSRMHKRRKKNYVDRDRVWTARARNVPLVRRRRFKLPSKTWNLKLSYKFDFTPRSITYYIRYKIQRTQCSRTHWAPAAVLAKLQESSNCWPSPVLKPRNFIIGFTV